MGANLGLVVILCREASTQTRTALGALLEEGLPIPSTTASSKISNAVLSSVML